MTLPLSAPAAKTSTILSEIHSKLLNSILLLVGNKIEPWNQCQIIIFESHSYYYRSDWSKSSVGQKLIVSLMELLEAWWLCTNDNTYNVDTGGLVFMWWLWLRDKLLYNSISQARDQEEWTTGRHSKKYLSYDASHDSTYRGQLCASCTKQPLKYFLWNKIYCHLLHSLTTVMSANPKQV